MLGTTPTSGKAGSLPFGTGETRERLELTAYRTLTWLARPIAPLILRLREKKGKEDPARRGERLGQASIGRPRGIVAWVHAASVGETSAVLPVIARLIERRPDLTVLLTTGTMTSAQFAAARLPERTLHQYVPLDSPRLVASFLDHWQPALGIFTEQEIWPNLVVEAGRRRIPLALVNARMSDASFARWQRRSGLAEALFSRFSVVLAQNEDLAQRFQRLGAPRAIAAGNLKIDAPAPRVDADALAALEQALAGRPRYVAASTHDGEELVLGETHRELQARFPGLVTIIAPRHPERGAAIAQTLAALGLVATRRSEGHLPGPDTQVYIADTIGELGTLYASAPVAFVGGSLIRHGGQNPIEAVRLGAVVVSGSSTYNFTDAYTALIAADGAVIVDSPADLASAIAELLTDPQRRDAMRTGSTRALLALSGALDRTVSALLPNLPEPLTGTDGVRAAE